MRKYLVLLGAAVLALATASPSMAQFSSWGHLEVMSYYSKDMDTFGIDSLAATRKVTRTSDIRQGVAERFRWFFQYGDPKTVRAVIGFEADSSNYGEPGTTGAVGVPGSTSAAYNATAWGQSMANKNHMGAYGTDQVALEIKWGFLDFVIPNTPISIMAGLQNFTIGGNIGRFWQNNDAPGIVVSGNFAPHTVQAFWWKFNKQDVFTDNDNDMYGLRYLLKQKFINVEAWVAYQNDRRSKVEAWSMPATTTTDPVTGVVTTNCGLRQTLTPRPYEVQPWWVGLNVPIRVGNWTFDPIVIYNFGKARKYRDDSGDDIKFDAWLADLAITYRLGPGLAFTVEGYYSTGHDADKANKENKYQFGGYGGDVITIFGGGKSVFFFSNNDLGYYNYKNQEIAGLWYGRANVEYSPFSWLTFGFNYFYFGDNSKGTPGTGRIVNTPTGARQDQDKDKIGQEANVIATFNIYKNFRYQIGFGYFFPGDVYDQVIAGKSQSADNAWNLLTNLRYAF